MNEDRFLVSDSIRDIIPDSQQDTDVSDDGFVIVAFSYTYGEISSVLVGSLLGISCEECSVKVDMQVSVSDVYSLVLEGIEGRSLENINLQTSHADSETSFSGFQCKEIKVFDLDRSTKMCTLAIDLIRRR